MCGEGEEARFVTAGGLVFGESESASNKRPTAERMREMTQKDTARLRDEDKAAEEKRVAATAARNNGQLRKQPRTNRRRPRRMWQHASYNKPEAEATHRAAEAEAIRRAEAEDETEQAAAASRAECSAERASTVALVKQAREGRWQVEVARLKRQRERAAMKSASTQLTPETSRSKGTMLRDASRSCGGRCTHHACCPRNKIAYHLILEGRRSRRTTRCRPGVSGRLPRGTPHRRNVRRQLARKWAYHPQ